MKRVDLSALMAVAVHDHPYIQKQVTLSPAGASVEVRRQHESMHEAFFVQQGNGEIIVAGCANLVEAGSCLVGGGG